MDKVPGRKLWSKEGLVVIFSLAIGILLSLLLQAPVGTSPQAPLLAHAVAPWIFGPVQIALLYLPPWLGAVLLPLAALACLTALPWLGKLGGRRLALGSFAAVGIIIGVLLLWFMGREYWWH
ncbi:MAG: hypothetical protein M0Z55_07260 [Peptococcaceae bacterium]|nr:hypothetical protein [Peptococcaceae bacterium]